MNASPVHLHDLLVRAGLRGSALEQALSLFSARRVDKGEPVLCQGERWVQAMFVERGILRMYFVDRDGKEFNKNFHAEGALICALTEAMAQQPSLFGIAAVEATQLWVAPADRLYTVLDAAGTWAPLRARLLEGLVTHKLQREHDLLALDGAQRYAQFCATHPQLANRLPLAHLATYLGLTNVSLSRIRRKLREAGD